MTSASSPAFVKLKPDLPMPDPLATLIFHLYLACLAAAILMEFIPC